jgi:hypothetical protein
MCGIVGFQGDFDPALLQSISAAVAHRFTPQFGWKARIERPGAALES